MPDAQLWKFFVDRKPTQMAAGCRLHQCGCFRLARLIILVAIVV